MDSETNDEAELKCVRRHASKTLQLIRKIIDLGSEIERGSCMSCQIVINRSGRTLHTSIHVNISFSDNVTGIKSYGRALRRN